MAIRKRRPESAKAEREETTYRGHKIEIVRQPSTAKRAGVAPVQLFIDGQEIEITQTPTGVESSQNIFAEYGSVHELAEAVARQWGTLKVRPVTPGHHHHQVKSKGGRQKDRHDH